jgi:hypothetical protein
MKLFHLREHYQDKHLEYIVGSRETGRHTVYLVYGEVSAGETRKLAPDGHDEILLLLAGEALLEGPSVKVSLSKEHVVSLEADESLTLTAVKDCCYVVAGTHTTPHEH